MAKLSSTRNSKVQGEGDYEAARRYRKRSEDYQLNNDVEKAALRAAPQSGAEAEELQAAEAAGRKRAKGEDPAIRRRAAPRSESAAAVRKSSR
jgi:hypothetical protein